MKVEKVKLKDLVSDDHNSVTHDVKNIDAVKTSVQKFGQYRPFVIQKSTNKVIIGNCMLLAMTQLGMKNGSAYFVDVDDKTARLMGATDNKTGELSEWDMSNLKDILSDQNSEDLLNLGWENFELDALLAVDSGKSPDFDGADDLEDFEIDVEKETAKKNTGRLNFTKEEWGIVRDAILKKRKEIEEIDEAEAVTLICKAYLESGNE